MDEIRQWEGDSPVFLLIIKDDHQIVIDVDESQWIAKHPEIFEPESTWHMFRKPPQPGLPPEHMVGVVVHAGETPYYMARHIGQLVLSADNEDNSRAEITAYGIGCARTNGFTDRFWMFPNGQVCIGELDVYDFAHAMLGQRAAQRQGEVETSPAE